MKRTFAADFDFGDRVLLDGDSSLVARVVAFSFRSEFPQIEVAWVHCGTLHSAWVDPFRLSAAPENT